MCLGAIDFRLVDHDRRQAQHALDLFDGYGEAAEGSAIKASEAIECLGARLQEAAHVVLFRKQRRKDEFAQRDIFVRVLERVVDKVTDLPASLHEPVPKRRGGAQNGVDTRFVRRIFGRLDRKSVV